MIKSCIITIACILMLQYVATAQKWQQLFDGSTMDGWEVRDANSPVLVKDGAIVAYHKDSTGHTYICTQESFNNFILELEVKVTGDLNSGILIRGIVDPDLNNGKAHGYQMEIDQSERQWTGGIFEEMGRGWLYSLQDKDEERKAYKPSEWNTYRIEVIDDIFKIWVNDQPVLHMSDNKTQEGVIGFQIHNLSKKFKGGSVSFRNVKILTAKLKKYSRDMPLPLLVVE